MGTAGRDPRNNHYPVGLVQCRLFVSTLQV